MSSWCVGEETGEQSGDDSIRSRASLKQGAARLRNRKVRGSTYAACSSCPGKLADGERALLRPLVPGTLGARQPASRAHNAGGFRFDLQRWRTGAVRSRRSGPSNSPMACARAIESGIVAGRRQLPAGKAGSADRLRRRSRSARRSRATDRPSPSRRCAGRRARRTPPPAPPLRRSAPAPWRPLRSSRSR